MSTSFSLFDLVPNNVVLDRFRIVKPHRRSGLASAFEVKDQTQQGAAARCELMVFPSALFEGPAQSEAYRDTWVEWLAVNSDHVLHVREVLDLGDSNMALLTDFPAGRSLRVALSADGRMAGAEVLELGRQLLSGMMEIHASGLVHGDIKPQTIFVENEPRNGVLVDGGITTGLWNAKHLGEHTALIGTPFYAPVEQFSGDSPGVQSDVYNLATVLFELACGVLPWAGSSMLEVFQAKLDKQLPSMASRAPDVEIDPTLAQAIVLGLAADRGQRYPTAEAFREALGAVQLA